MQDATAHAHETEDVEVEVTATRRRASAYRRVATDDNELISALLATAPLDELLASVKSFTAEPRMPAPSNAVAGKTPQDAAPSPAALAQGFHLLAIPPTTRSVYGHRESGRTMTSGLSISKTLFFAVITREAAHESNLGGGRIAMLAIAKTQHRYYGLARNRIAWFTAHGGWLQSLPDDHSEAQALLNAVVAHFN